MFFYYYIDISQLTWSLWAFAMANILYKNYKIH